MIVVIVPVYKVEQYLKGCIDSILCQTFRNFTLILVDDGSPDACGEICEEYAKKDERVHVLHKENGGLSSARNAGLDWAFKHLEFEYIAFVDSDDHVSVNYLQLLYDGIRDSDADMSVVNLHIGDDPGGELPESRNDRRVLDPEEFWTVDSMLANVAWCKLYKAKIFSELRYPEGKIGEDSYIAHLICFEHCNRIVVNATKAYYYLKRSGSITKCRWSPKEYDCLNGVIVQVEYFKARAGTEPNVLKCTYEALIGMLLGEFKSIDKTVDNYRQHVTKMHCMLSKYGMEYVRTFNIAWGAHYELYHGLHPYLMNRLTWPVFRLFYLLKRILSE